MKFPKFLNEKGKIGLVAPSFGVATEPYYSCANNAIAKFKDMGYYVNLGPNCYVEKGIGISNTPELCAKELMEEYANPDNDIIISCGGGECMCETMSRVDFDLLKKAEPKWYMGYSDNTNMTFLLTTILDTASIYGPCVSTFGMEPWHKYVKDTWDLLTGKNVEEGYAAATLTGKNVEEGYAAALLTGKNVEEGYAAALLTGKNIEEGYAAATLTGKNVEEYHAAATLVGNGGRESRGPNESAAMVCEKIRYITVSNYDSYEVESLKSPENPFAPINATEPVEIKAYSPEIMSYSSENMPHSPKNMPYSPGIMSIDYVNFEGRLIGGCLDCLVNLLGTRLDYVNQFIEKYKEDGIIWYLEACDLNVFAQRRALWQMYEAGWFKYAKGFIFGRPANSTPIANLNHIDSALEIPIKTLKVPVILDADIGHLPPQMPIINGSYAQVNFEQNKLFVKMFLA